MKVVQNWMTINGKAIKHVNQLPADEEASVPATANENFRYLFAIPKFRNNSKYDEDRLPAEDLTLTLKTALKPKSVKMVGSNNPLDFTYSHNKVSVSLPAANRTSLVDVVQVEL